MTGTLSSGTRFTFVTGAHCGIARHPKLSLLVGRPVPRSAVASESKRDAIVGCPFGADCGIIGQEGENI
jgi:hypothetical protein